MVKRLLIVNALLTLPFGVAGLAAPAAVFAQFGLQLDAGAALIARGYAATLLAYGVVLYFGRRSADPRMVRSLLVSIVLFNAIEAVIQGIAGARGIAAPIIFATVAIHTVVTVLSVIALSRHQLTPRTE